MTKGTRATAAWARMFGRSMTKLTQASLGAAARASRPPKPRAKPKAAALAKARPKLKTPRPLTSPSRATPTRASPAVPGDWIAGMAISPAGARRYRLYRPPGIARDERLPVLVMLHGCEQDAEGFAASTRMNRVAARERFLVLYPEQDRLSNPKGCWNWFDTRTGRAQREADLILRAVDQVVSLYGGDGRRVAVAGLSAGASMAALLATLHPARFQAVMMHSGIPPGAAHSTLSALTAMHGRRVPAALTATPADMKAQWPALLVIQGATDRVVDSRNAVAAAQVWADAAGAKQAPERRMRNGLRYPVTLTEFQASPGRRMIAKLVLVDQLGHAWSGGAARQPYSDPLGPDASRMVWSFAAKCFAA